MNKRSDKKIAHKNLTRNGTKKIRQEIEQNSREVIEQNKSNRKYWPQMGEEIEQEIRQKNWPEIKQEIRLKIRYKNQTKK